MQVIADVCVIPIKDGESLAHEVAVCQKILQQRGLKHQMHAYGTNIEGEWDEIMAVIKSFHQQLHERGISRISSSIRLGTRTDKSTSIEDKIARVERLL